jgi:beta-glucosidase/6-phospho-beta-glucosidase/beta-galactosidase
MEPQPERDFDPAAVSFYDQMIDELKRRKETVAKAVSGQPAK